MLEKRLKDLWRSLQGKKPHLPNFLSAIRLDGIRGFNNLRVPFDYPVSVIAGGNTTGKSTVLFATACAYKVPDILCPYYFFLVMNPRKLGMGSVKRHS